jgi:hypothetical protein
MNESTVVIAVLAEMDAAFDIIERLATESAGFFDQQFKTIAAQFLHGQLAVLQVHILVGRISTHLVDDGILEVFDAQKRGRSAVLRIDHEVKVNFIPVVGQAVVIETGHKVPVVADQQGKIK